MSQKPSAPLRVKLRPDLVVAEIDTPRGKLWHVKDPLALKFYQFDSREYGLLTMLDGRATMEELLARYQRQFAPQYLSARQLLFLIDEARRNGLLIIDRAAGVLDDEAPANRQNRFVHWLGKLNILSIQLPGIDPDEFLNATYPLVRWAFTKFAVVLGGLLFLSALLLVTLRFDEVLDRLPDQQQFFTPQSVLWVMAAIGVTKVLHELAHAYTCKHYRGECHELGLMLLVFVPCLYCNVSDSWLLARRRERMLITAAGMLMELVLASLATFVWWFAIDGPVRMAALSVMLVTSVSTLLLNGNPLMRYDGYYLLSDWLRVPNLGSESTLVLQQHWRRWGLGIREAAPLRTDLPRSQLAAYGIASFIYRLFLFASILLAVHALARGYRLQVLAWIVTLLSLSSLLMPLVISAAQPFLRHADRRRMSPAHVTMTLLVLGCVVGGMLFIPVPHSVRAPLVIEAEGAERLFVTVPGTLVESRSRGATVRAGDVVARLENPDLLSELRSLEAHQQLLQTQLASYLTVRGDDEERGARPGDAGRAGGDGVAHRDTPAAVGPTRHSCRPRRCGARRPTCRTSRANGSRPAPGQARRWTRRTWAVTWNRRRSIACLAATARSPQA
ncbi:MAG: hypothetical protein R3B90_10530 [Planctomycetaceae bacterium]